MQAFPGPGGKWQISTDGGGELVWARSGRELFYRNGDKMMVVPVQTQGMFTPGKPQLLFQAPFEVMDGFRPNFDVTPDGQRFLMIKDAAPDSAPTQINVVLNWFEELKRRDPERKK